MRCVRAVTIAVLALAAAVFPSRLLAQDFYYYRDTRVPVARAAHECLVSFTASAPSDRRALVARLGSLTLGEEVTSGGRTFYIVSLSSSSGNLRDGPTIDQVIDLLRASQDIAFAAPVFYEPASSARLLVTDEVVVKTKAGTTRTAFEAVCQQRGLMIADTMRGTTNEYVLRLQSKDQNALEVSRLLYESGLFDWAEPSFIREVRR